MSAGQVIFDIVVGVLSLYSIILGIINQRMLNQRRQFFLSHYERRRQVSDD